MKVTGIVIKKQNKGECDQLLTVFTKECGKVVFLAKGVRKESAKLAGHLGLLNMSEIVFVRGRQFKIITSAAELENFSSLKKDTAKVQSAKHIANLADVCILEEEKDEAVFNLAVGALDYLNRKEMNQFELKMFLRYFEFKLLSLLGYEPEDKTIAEAFTNSYIRLSDGDLDEMANRFSKYFQNIYNNEQPTRRI